MYVKRLGIVFNSMILLNCGSSLWATIKFLMETSPEVIMRVACEKSVYVREEGSDRKIRPDITGKITPFVRVNEVRGNLTFLLGKVLGVFLISLTPNLAFEGTFFLLEVIGLSRESASSNHFTSSAVKCLPVGIDKRLRMCSVCSSDKTCLFFSSSIRSFK